MRLPRVILRTGEITAVELAAHVEAQAADLAFRYPDATKIILIRAQRSLETIYLIYAALVSGRRIACIDPACTPEEEASAKRTLGEVYAFEIFSGPERSNPIASLPPQRWQPENFELLIFTSGTTAAPKAVVLKASNLQASAQGHAENFNLNENHIWLANMPLHHIGGISVLTRAFFLNQDIAFTAESTVDSLRFWMESGKIHGASLVPTLLFRLNAAAEFSVHKNFKLFLVGGAELSEELLKACSLRFPGIAIVPSYGMSETCSQALTGSIDNPPPIRAHALFPLPGIQAKISELGELAIAGPTLFCGYFVGGKFIPREGDWFPTGDLAIPGKLEKSFQVVGRKSDVIISGGVNINPLEIEAIFQRLAPNTECAVVGIPDPEWGEIAVLAYCTVDASEIPAIEAIAAQMRNLLSAKKIPKKFIRLKELPRNKTGKLLRRILREQLKNPA